MEIRAETERDFDAIDAVHRCAFDDDAEAALVRQLRADGDVVCAFVAEADGMVLGHVMFSRLRNEPNLAAALAPVAVLPERQRRGAGAALIRRGVEECRALGYDFVYVVGEPGYYGRFGFSTAAAEGVRSPYSGPYFLALSCNGKAPSGELKYPAAFADL